MLLAAPNGFYYSYYVLFFSAKKTKENVLKNSANQKVYGSHWLP